ncbi:MAG: hypothetical protein WAP55_02380, partial [Minisyncoccia bacterium]
MAEDGETEKVGRELDELEQEHGSGDWFFTSVAISAFGAFGVVILLFFVSQSEFSDIRSEMAAKANTSVVAQEIARLDYTVSTKANWTDLDSARTMVGDLFAVNKVLNTRVVAAEQTIGKNTAAAAAARRSAREAAELAAQVRTDLVQLKH